MTFCPECGVRVTSTLVSHLMKRHPEGGRLIVLNPSSRLEPRDKEVGAFVRKQLRLTGGTRVHWRKTVSGLLILSDRDLDEILESNAR